LKTPALKKTSQSSWLCNSCYVTIYFENLLRSSEQIKREISIFSCVVH